jgi:uncharacterized membrane protein
MAGPSVAERSGRDPGAVACALLALGAIAASVALALEQLAGDWTRGFVTGNALPQGGRGYLLAAMLGSAAAGVGAGVALWRVGRGAGAARLLRAARLAAPLVLAGLVPGLLAIDPWAHALVLALSLGAFLLAAEPLLRLAFGAGAELFGARARALADRVPPLVRRYGPAAVVVVAAVAYAVYMTFFTVRNHHKFGTYTWDLAHLDNEFWNDLHGRPFRNTLAFRQESWGNVRNHFQPTIFALVPLYALWPRAEGLLALQALIIAAGAIPLYRFAARRLPRPTAALLAVAYLLYPPTHGAQFFDFHFQPIAAAFLLAAADGLDGGHPRLFWLFLALAIGCREDVSAGTAMIGLVLVLAGRRSPVPPRTAAAIFGVSVVYFVGIRFFVMRAAGSTGFADLYQGLLPAGEGTLVGLVKTLVTNPLFTLRTLLSAEKLRYLLQILAPLAFLPLRRPITALLLLPGCFFTILTTDYAPTVEIFFHYGGAFVAYVFAGSAIALASVGAGPDGLVRRRAAAATLALGTLIATAAWGAFPPRHPLRSSYGWIDCRPPTPEERQRADDINALARIVPKDAIVAVSDREAPHLSNRRECWSLAGGFQGSDYILYTAVHPAPTELEQVAAAERAGYVRVAARSGLILLKRPGAP